MAASKPHDLVILQGKTFLLPLRWEAPPVIFKPITGITQSAPVNITCPTHGLVNGWRVAVVSVKGMTQINSDNDPPKDKDYRRARVVDPNTVEFDGVNASGFKPYVSGGLLQYNTPVDLAGYSAQMQIKGKVGGTVLLDVTPYITLDNVAKLIQVTIPADITEAITWKKGVYELEMRSGGNIVSTLCFGSVAVTREITT